MSDYKNRDEYREFWVSVDKAAEEVAKWPEWMIDRVMAAKFATTADKGAEISVERR